MLNIAAKFLLASSALSPPLLILAANLLVRKASCTLWLTFLLVGLGLILSAILILVLVSLQAEIHRVHVQGVEPRNYEAITFLFAYIFPFIQQDFSGTTANLATTATIFALLIIVLVHSEAFHFNPLLRVLGYRFYAVRTLSGVTSLIILRQALLVCPTSVKVVSVAPGVYLQKGALDA